MTQSHPRPHVCSFFRHLCLAFLVCLTLRGHARAQTDLLPAGFDFNNDGIDDSIRLIAYRVGSTELRRVRIHSGAGGAVLRDMTFAEAAQFFGSALWTGAQDAIFDVNDDGTISVQEAIYALRPPLRDTTGDGLPDSVLLNTLLATEDSDGRYLVRLFDLNADAIDDWVLVLPTVGDGTDRTGRALVYSGATRALLYSLAGPPGERFGFAAVSVPDQDLDGRSDLVIWASWDDPVTGAARFGRRLHSGASGQLLFSEHDPVLTWPVGFPDDPSLPANRSGRLRCSDNGGGGSGGGVGGSISGWDNEEEWRDEWLACWCLFHRHDPLCLDMGGSEGQPPPPPDCDVYITGPTIVGVGDAGQLQAHGSPIGGTYQWRVTEGQNRLAGQSGQGSLFNFTTGSVPGPVTVVCKYTVTNCTAGAAHSFDIVNCRVDPVSCPDAPVLSSGQVEVAGIPQGGAWTWEIIQGADLISPIGPTNQPVLQYLTGPSPGLVVLRAGYQTASCETQRLLYFDVVVLPTEDFDGDGLGDAFEWVHELDLADWDMDDDTISDGLEDLDHDDLNNLGEQTYGTDPWNPDTDDDSLYDGCEVVHSYDPTNPGSPAGALTDSDGDGLINGEEICAGTNEYGWDSDNDGVSDGGEADLGTDPTNPDSDSDGVSDGEEDEDGDGLSNMDEETYGTDLHDPDSDDDGVSDGDEVGQGSNPTDSQDSTDAFATGGVSKVLIHIRSRGWLVPGEFDYDPLWEFEIGRMRVRTPNARDAATRTLTLRRDQTYEVRINYLGHAPAPPDARTGPGRGYWALIVPREGAMYVEDPEGLLGPNDGRECCEGEEECEEWESACNPAEGKTARLILPIVDLDVDTDNTNGLDLPDRSQIEEDWEDRPDSWHPGKTILSDWSDSDHDLFPDYADGYDLSPDLTQDDVCETLRFVPVVLQWTHSETAVATVGFSYDCADPADIETTDYDPFLVGGEGGGLRLWMRDGGVARDYRSVAEGGDFIAPGTYTAEQLGFSATVETRTFYLEYVTSFPERFSAPLRMTCTWISEHGPQEEDEVFINPAFVGLFRGDTAAYDCNDRVDFGSLTDYLIATDLPETEAEVPPEGFTVGAYQVYSIRVWDGRPLPISEISVGGNAVPLHSDGHPCDDRSDPFIVRLTTDAAPLEPPTTDWIVLDPLQEVIFSYNPIWGVEPPVEVRLPTPDDTVVANLVKTVTETMHAENWTPPNPDDAGAFGKVVHQQMTDELSGRPGWIANAYVEKNTNKLLSIGEVPHVPSGTYVEVDIMRLEDGYLPQVGEVLDRARMIDIYEVKTSISGKVAESQRAKLKAIIGRDIKVTTSEWNWTAGQGMIKNNVWKAGAVAISFLGVGASAWAYVHCSDYDAELDDIFVQYSKAMEARRDRDEDPSGVTCETVFLAELMNTYLARFLPDGLIADVASVLELYEIMGLEENGG